MRSYRRKELAIIGSFLLANGVPVQAVEESEGLPIGRYGMVLSGKEGCEIGSLCAIDTLGQVEVRKDLLSVHLNYKYRIPATVVRDLGLSKKEVANIESSVEKTRKGTPYLLTRWTNNLKNNANMTAQEEREIHLLTLEWESRNCSLRLQLEHGAFGLSAFNQRMEESRMKFLADVKNSVRLTLYEVVRESVERVD